MNRRGAAMDRANDEALAEAARRTPGENILIGLQLSDFARVLVQHPVEKEFPVPPVRIWRALRRRRAQG